MDPLTLCLKRQRTGYATVTTPCQPSPVFTSLSLALPCARVCVRGMRVVARGVETHRRTLLVRELALRKVAVSSIFYFPIFLIYFDFLLCSLLSYCCICEIMSRIFLY